MPADLLVVRPRAAAWPSPSALAAFAAGSAAAFTIPLVGEEPAGELVLVAVAGWAILCALLRGRWPGPLLSARYCRLLLAAEAVAFAAYVVSDLYRRSRPHDYLRGWSRIFFLGLDVVATAYLFGRSPRNLVVFVLGQGLGQALHAVLAPPLFDELWKFGYATPVSLLGFAAAPAAGAAAAAGGAVALGALNFLLDYRSEGGICVLTGVLTVLQLSPRKLRAWLAPLFAAAATAAVLGLYSRTRDVSRTDRSDLERSAMMTVAARAFVQSPLLGHGSWFSNSRVYDDFVALRASLARQAGVPGFPPANTNPGDVAFHSQILVALAEGGLFGGAFFIVYGIGLVRAIGRLVFRERWSRFAPLALYLLVSAFWDLIFSPFSGLQRVNIALTCGLLLLVLRPGGLSAALPSRRP